MPQPRKRERERTNLHGTPISHQVSGMTPTDDVVILGHSVRGRLADHVNPPFPLYMYPTAPLPRLFPRGCQATLQIM